MAVGVTAEGVVNYVMPLSQLDNSLILKEFRKSQLFAPPEYLKILRRYIKIHGPMNNGYFFIGPGLPDSPIDTVFYS